MLLLNVLEMSKRKMNYLLKCQRCMAREFVYGFLWRLYISPVNLIWDKNIDRKKMMKMRIKTTSNFYYSFKSLQFFQFYYFLFDFSMLSLNGLKKLNNHFIHSSWNQKVRSQFEISLDGLFLFFQNSGYFFCLFHSELLLLLL